MSRVFKFRAWDGVELRYDVAGFRHSETGEPQVLLSDGGLFNISENPVMQYTGLKDSKGVEIYDGDIVKGLRHYSDDIDQIAAVRQVSPAEWLWGCYGNIYIALDYDCKTEVIGNIHENKDILDNIDKDGTIKQ